MELTFQNLINVEGLFSFHYFEFTRTYVFDGESHPFWEFQYVDKGNYTVTTDGIAHRLGQGDVIFHRPNEYHSGIADGKTNPNLLVVSFSGSKLDELAGVVLSVPESARNQLAALLSLAKKNFAAPLDNENVHALGLTENASMYDLNEIKLRLELFLLDCLENVRRSTPKETGYRQTIERVAVFLQSSVKNNVTLSETAARFHLNRDYLNRLFKAHYGMTMIDYFIDLKVNAAKDCLRLRELSVKEIARQLGYSSDAYFCHQFRDRTGFTPSEYQRSIIAKNNRAPY